MLTNPNTCGLFERDVVAIAEAVHAAGAYFYADGANFNAIVGKVKPGDLGVDAMHINLHKTFSTPAWRRRPGRRAGGLLGEARALRAGALRPADGGRRRVHRDAARRPATGAKPFGRMTAFHGQMGMFVRAHVLHARPRRRRHAPGVGGRGAQRQLHPRRRSAT